MNRRELLLYGFAAAAGAGLTSLFYQNLAEQAGNPAIDLERQLIQMVIPESAALLEKFPQYPSYEATVKELSERGVVYKGGLDKNAIENFRGTDEIIEFNGWQHLETELLLLLAAYQLAGDHLTVTQSNQEQLSFNTFLVTDGVDSAGDAIAAYRIDSTTDYAALSACLDLCDKEENCRNITLAKADHPDAGKQNMCWLTGDNVQRNPSPHYFTASKR